MLLFSLFLACGTPQKSLEEPQDTSKTTQVAPNQQNSDSQKAKKALQSCIDKCVQSKQMEARGIEAIKADCEKQCTTPVPKLELQPK